MTMIAPFVAELPPLQQDDTGTIRVGKTRVTLDTVVGAWEDGATAEEIVQSYDVLALADVHAALSYYLRHREDIEAYMTHREQEAETIRQENERRFPPDAFRERLLARRDARNQA